MKIRKITRCGLFVALLTVCAWLCVPFGQIPFTLQSFGVCLCLLLLGGKWGSCAVLVYLLLGAAGAPIFSGFRGGLGTLLGPGGGYLWGFLLMALLFWLISAKFPKGKILALILGHIVCYAAGSLWYYLVYLHGSGIEGFMGIMLQSVAPFLLPDGIKLAMAVALEKKLRTLGNAP